MKRIFPYGIRIGEGGDVEVVPVARARVRSANGESIPVVFLLDSGATTSLLPLTDAEALGIDIARGEKISLQGISGEALVGFRHNIILYLEGFPPLAVPAAFSMRSDIPRILGREGVFANFGILFDEAKRRIGFLEHRTERKSIDRLLAS